MPKRTFNQMTPEVRSELGRRGGERTSQDKEHMQEIGRRGGAAFGRKRDPAKAILQAELVAKLMRAKLLLKLSYKDIGARTGVKVSTLHNAACARSVGAEHLRKIALWLDEASAFEACSSCDGHGYRKRER